MPATAFTIVLILPALHLVGLELRGAWVWAPLLVVFGLIPLLDPLVGRTPLPPISQGLVLQFLS